jgi:hypothetical protein
MLETDTGEVLPFLAADGSPDLQGGDVVEFELGGTGGIQALNVTLRQRWATLLNERHRPLVNQLHDTVQLKP